MMMMATTIRIIHQHVNIKAWSRFSDQTESLQSFPSLHADLPAAAETATAAVPESASSIDNDN
jgi:hypothetical protein